MLGTEPEIIANYVENGKVKIIFWPVLNHGDPSLYSTLAAECVGQQNPNLFWDMHHLLFENQRDIWGATRDYYIETAVFIGANQATFEACYDGPSGVATILELDTLRREKGIFNQPTFDINGAILAGSHPYDTFAEAFDSLE